MLQKLHQKKKVFWYMVKDDNIMTICVDTYEIFYKTED